MLNNKFFFAIVYEHKSAECAEITLYMNKCVLIHSRATKVLKVPCFVVILYMYLIYDEEHIYMYIRRDVRD